MFLQTKNLINHCKSNHYEVLKVARPGFEPRQTEPKSVVLPLYYRAAQWDAKISDFKRRSQKLQIEFKAPYACFTK